MIRYRYLHSIHCILHRVHRGNVVFSGNSQDLTEGPLPKQKKLRTNVASLWWTRILEKSSEFLVRIVIFVYFCAQRFSRAIWHFGWNLLLRKASIPREKFNLFFKHFRRWDFNAVFYSGQIERLSDSFNAGDEWYEWQLFGFCVLSIQSLLHFISGILELEEMREHACYSPSEVERGRKEEDEWKMGD